ncbi:unnamed protein product [Timema podura]|uniref:Vesicle tethering protein Uso1/P115-like head domain-containing protein n=1 Tax=Timema podura TaxID=61482 RepID=A0ABN7NX26_TIMPD|nr:unnamed protein product [Timema podura]
MGASIESLTTLPLIRAFTSQSGLKVYRVLFLQDKLKQLVGNRIGVEVFVDKLGEVSKHEVYSKAAKHPQLKPQFPSDLLLDHEFCQLFKALEGVRFCFEDDGRDQHKSVLRVPVSYLSLSGDDISGGTG